MLKPILDTIFAWLMIAVATAYMLEMPWRQWRNRPPKRWMPLYLEFLLPLVYLWLSLTSSAPVALRVLTAAFMFIALVHRLILRRRVGVPAWPPV
jgi:hypothetical protein